MRSSHLFCRCKHNPRLEGPLPLLVLFMATRNVRVCFQWSGLGLHSCGDLLLSSKAFETLRNVSIYSTMPLIAAVVCLQWLSID